MFNNLIKHIIFTLVVLLAVYIEETKTKGKRFKVVYKNPKTQKLSTKRFDDEKIARLFDLEHKTYGTGKQKQEITFDYLAMRFKDDYMPSMTLRGQAAYRYAFNNHIADYFAGMFVNGITLKTIQEFQQHLIEKDLSPSSVNKIITTLSSIFSRGIEWGLIEINPTQNLKKQKEPVKQVKIPSIEDIEGALSRCDESSYILLSLVAYAGLRPSECLSLSSKDFDWSQGLIYVNKSVDEDGTLKSTKTSENRIIKMFPWLIEDLKPRIQNTDILFPNAQGSYWTHGNYVNYNKRIFKSKISPDYSLYTYRHAYVSLRLAAFHNSVAVSKAAGHSLMTMFKTYAHILDNLDETSKLDIEKEVMFFRKS